jgi:hypothetical protein
MTQQYFSPVQGHAVVSLDDGMSELTNGYLHSCLHWVSPLPGRSMHTRYSSCLSLARRGPDAHDGLEERDDSEGRSGGGEDGDEWRVDSDQV